MKPDLLDWLQSNFDDPSYGGSYREAYDEIIRLREKVAQLGMPMEPVAIVNSTRRSIGCGVVEFHGEVNPGDALYSAPPTWILEQAYEQGYAACKPRARREALLDARKQFFNQISISDADGEEHRIINRTLNEVCIQLEFMAYEDHVTRFIDSAAKE